MSTSIAAPQPTSLPATSRAPVIGISAGNSESPSLSAAIAQVRQAGGIPLVLTEHNVSKVAEDFAKIDGLMVLGNNFDIDPNEYTKLYPAGDIRHQEHPKTNDYLAHVPKNEALVAQAKGRAEYEKALLALARDAQKPTLAICGGMQLLNVLQGGGLIQHVPDLEGVRKDHLQSEYGIPSYCPVVPITVSEKKSLLGAIVGERITHYASRSETPEHPENSTAFWDNSFHHQAVDPDHVGQGLRVVAVSDAYKNPSTFGADAGKSHHLVEALEPDPEGPYKDWKLIATQWHPEYGASDISAGILRATVENARAYQQAHTTTTTAFARSEATDHEGAFVSNLRNITYQPQPLSGKTPEQYAEREASKRSHVDDMLTRRAEQKSTKVTVAF